MITRIEAVADTHPGMARENNEDRVHTQVLEARGMSPVGLLIVCDGIGGHLAGEYASHWAVEAIKRELAELFSTPDPRATVRLSRSELDAALAGQKGTIRLPESDAVRRVRKAVEKANEVVYAFGQNKPEAAHNAGSTVTMALIEGSIATIANVGDSRTYCLRDGALRQLTTDHSLVARLVAAGHISPEEVYDHDQRNIIFRSLGQNPEVTVDVSSIALKAGDVLLLCSDGLWEMVRDPASMANIIESAADLGTAAANLIQAANDAGGEDNIGVALARVT